jgi:hypothetical protein
MVSLKKFLLLFMVLILFLIPGCRKESGLPTYYVSQDVDFSFIKRVVVLPLDNLTDDKYAGDIIKQVIISELLASGLVDVVVPGEVLQAINELGIKSITSLSAEEIKALGNALKVEAIVMGTVEEYGEVKMGGFSAPQVTITLMMADSGSGIIVWSITKTRGGAGFLARHFGARHETISETVLTLVREAIQTLVPY